MVLMLILIISNFYAELKLYEITFWIRLSDGDHYINFVLLYLIYIEKLSFEYFLKTFGKIFFGF